uniref:GDSL esterase/lipase n=1 Tax=Aegilops tauschii TaxID=37682 RepID=M8BI82_AEGTA
MERRVSPWLLLVVLLVAAASGRNARADPQVPCYFVFGDSLVDNGNNNDIASLARANYPPYGIDFPGGATGRFSNGLTTVDAISRLLGFDDYIPAICEKCGLINVARTLPKHGTQGQRISFGGQLQNYQAAVQQLVSILGDEDSAADHLSQCIFTVGMGSNDYLNNYFMPTVYSTSRQYTPEQYADVLILYNNGARKVALMGVGQVGCSPNELAQQSSDGVTCVARINGAIEIFNRKLVELVDQFNTLPGAHFTYINAYGIFQDIIRSPGANGKIWS